VYVSFDDGARWQPLQLNLPIVPVTDLAVKGNDLVGATQGRGFWILDDLAPLRAVAANPRDAAARKAHLYEVSPAVRLPNAFTPPGSPPPGLGQNPPTGVVLHYWLKEAPPAKDAGKVKLEILTADGQVIRTFTGKPAEGRKPAEPRPAGEGMQEEAQEKEADLAKDKGGEAEMEAELEKEKDEDEEPVKIPTEAGLNRFVWDMTWPRGKDFPNMILWSGRPPAPVAIPGSYQARLTVGEETFTQPFEIRKDPRSSATQEDLEAQLRFLMDVRDKLTETHDAIRRIREVRAQLDDTKKRLRGKEDMKPVLDAARDLDKKMTAVEEALYQTRNKSSQDPLNFPIRLNDKLAGVADSAALGDYRPTAQAVRVKEQLTAAIDAELAKLRQVWEGDLVKLNELAREKGVAAVIVPEPRLK
ncbi:MAG TPA: glycosyl hydrolase, partial [Thermoanaerobaculia bacterium]